MPKHFFRAGRRIFVSSRGDSDVTLSHFEFPTSARAHFPCSWLHRLQDVKLVGWVGFGENGGVRRSSRPVVSKIRTRVEWKNRLPTACEGGRGSPMAPRNREDPLQARMPALSGFASSSDRSRQRRAGKSYGSRGSTLSSVRCQICGNAGESGTTKLRDFRTALLRARIRVRHEGAKISGHNICHFSHVIKCAHIGNE